MATRPRSRSLGLFSRSRGCYRQRVQFVKSFVWAEPLSPSLGLGQILDFFKITVCAVLYTSGRSIETASPPRFWRENLAIVHS